MNRSIAAAALAASLLAAPHAGVAQVPLAAPTLPAVAPSPSGGALPPPPQPAALPPVPEVAPGYRAPEVGSPGGELAGVTAQPFVGIALETAVAMALAKNTDLAVSQSNRRIAGFQVSAAQGAYDVRFQVVPSYSHVVTAPTNSFFTGPGGGPYTTDTSGLNAGFAGKTATGGSYQISGSGQRVTADSTLNGFNPYYPTALAITLTQPLLRGLRIDDTRRQIELARINEATSSAAALQSAATTVAGLLDAYWDLVAAWRNVAIQEEGLREAQAQAQSNARLVRQGAAAPADIVESNTQVNVFQDNLFSALQNVARLQNHIKQLMLSDPADPLWLANLVPTSNVGQLPPVPQLNAALVMALAQRPEVAQIAQARKTAGVNLLYARDQLKPQLDLQAGYTSNGLAGQSTNPAQNPTAANSAAQASSINALIANANRNLPPGQQIPLLSIAPVRTPGYLSGGLDQSASNLFTNKFPTYNAQVVLGFPLRNRTAKAGYAIAQEQAAQVEVNQIALIQRITVETRNALQAFASARYRLVAAGAARAAAESVYASELRRFRAGQSTTFLVLARQLDLANNRGRELQAQTDLNKAVVEVDRVTGAILANNHVDATSVGSSTLGARAPALAPAASSLPNPRPTPYP